MVNIITVGWCVCVEGGVWGRGKGGAKVAFVGVQSSLSASVVVRQFFCSVRVEPNLSELAIYSDL